MLYGISECVVLLCLFGCEQEDDIPTRPEVINKMIAPTNLKATAVSSSRVLLSWDRMKTNNSSLELERLDNSLDEFKSIQSLTDSQTTWTDTALIRSIL